MTSTPLSITALGIASSLGDVVTACAAIRAGMSRAAEVSSHKVLDIMAHEMTPVVGHPVGTLTDGFEAAGRWGILASEALTDLRAHAHLPPVDDKRFWEKTGLVLVTPGFDDYRFYYAPECRPGPVWSDCIEPALTEAGIDILPARTRFVSCGPAGVAQAFLIAHEWLDVGEIQRVLLLAFDSLLDSRSLAALGETRRLKCDDNPVGLAPGEAACALLLERATDGRALATVAHSAFNADGPPFFEPEARCNPSLNKVLRSALQARSSKESFAGDIIVNLNGEEWRAAAYGAALASLPAGALGDHHLVPPAVSLGDTGAAAGAVAIAVGARSFLRRYACTSEVVIVALSESGEAGAVLLRRGEIG